MNEPRVNLPGWWQPRLVTWLMLGLLACGLLGVGFFSYSWLKAGTTPVKVCVYAANALPISLGFADDEAAFPLVPLTTEGSDSSWFWITELPPRRDYQLRLEFPEGLPSTEAVWVRLTELSPINRQLAELPLSPEYWDLVHGTWTAAGEKWWLSGEPGMVLTAKDTIALRPEGLGFAAWAWITLGLGGAILFALFHSGLYFPAQNRTPALAWSRRANVLFLGVMVASALAMIVLVTTSLASYWPADSTTYMVAALQWLEHGNFQPGGYQFELNRLPGYAIFIAGAMTLFGFSLQSITLSQALVTALAVGLLLWSLRRAVYPGLLIVATPLVFLAPPLIWAQRQIATEGLFISLIALGIWTWWQGLHATQRRWQTGWLVAFTVMALAATFVRPNGVILLALPGCVLVSQLWTALWRHGFAVHRQSGLAFAVGQFVLPIGVVFSALGFWAARNADYLNYPKPSDTTPIVWANAPFIFGFFDPRATNDAEDYARILRQRHDSGFFYHGWSLRAQRVLDLTQNWADIPETLLLDLEASLDDFVARNWEFMPAPVRPMASWRVHLWGFWIPEGVTYYPFPVAQDYTVVTASTDVSNYPAAVRNLNWASRSRGMEAPPAYPEGTPTWLQAIYNRLVPLYPWYYRTLLLLGLAGLIYATWRRAHCTAVFFMPFFLNYALNGFLLYILGRYVQILDFLLLAGLLVLATELIKERAAVPLVALAEKTPEILPDEKPCPVP